MIKTHFDLYSFFKCPLKKQVKFDPVVIMGCLCREIHIKWCQTIMNNKKYNKTKIIVIKSYKKNSLMILCNNIKIMFHDKKAHWLEFNWRVARSKYDPKHKHIKKYKQVILGIILFFISLSWSYNVFACSVHHKQ